MAKIDDVLDQLATGFQNPQVSFSSIMVDDQYMEQIKVRRKATGVAQHKLVVLSIGEMGAQAAQFYGHRLSDCLKKALEWRGLPTKNRRASKNGQPQQAG